MCLVFANIMLVDATCIWTDACSVFMTDRRI